MRAVLCVLQSDEQCGLRDCGAGGGRCADRKTARARDSLPRRGGCMNPWLTIGALYGFLGVAFGAFGAHALRARLSADALAIWHTAVEYQFYHAGALLIVGLDRKSTRLNSSH